MPYAILKFKLPEENEEFEVARNGANYCIAFEDLDNYLRNILKYGTLTEEQEKIYEEVRNKLHEFKRDND